MGQFGWHMSGQPMIFTYTMFNIALFFKHVDEYRVLLKIEQFSSSSSSSLLSRHLQIMEYFAKIEPIDDPLVI